MNRQCISQGLLEPSERDDVSFPHCRGPLDLQVGGTECVVHHHTTSGRGSKYSGRLAQLPETTRLRMKITYPSLQGNNRFGIPRVDLFASTLNAQLDRFFSRVQEPGAEDRHPALPLASGSTVCISSSCCVATGIEEGLNSQGGCYPSDTILAEENLVPRPDTSVNTGSLGDPTASGPTVAGPSVMSSTPQISPDSLEVERMSLSSLGFSAKVINTILSSRRLSTGKVYGSAWGSIQTMV